jgi:integrase
VPQKVNRLNHLMVSKIMPPGFHADGNNLYLKVSPTGSKTWTLIYNHQGRRRELGLGKLGIVSLADARRRALEAAQLRQRGLDPKTVWAAERRPSGTEVTFGQLALEVISDREGAWRNAKSAAQWESSLRAYAKSIWNKPVAEVDVDDIHSILRPIWTKKPETAKRVRGRMQTILAAAKVRKLRTGENPAVWTDNLAHLLPGQKRGPKRHQPSMPYEELPVFIEVLRERTEVSARALELTILTACRTTEVREATWKEFDLTNGIWNIPADRMKMDRDHRVALSSQALDLLARLPRGSDLLFPGIKRGKSISQMTMLQLLKRLDRGHYTVHGFRSTFSTWAAEQTEFPRELVELSLAHLVGSEVERAYRRTDGFGRRVALMQAWADFAYGPSESANQLYCQPCSPGWSRAHFGEGSRTITSEASRPAIPAPHLIDARRGVS